MTKKVLLSAVLALVGAPLLGTVISSSMPTFTGPLMEKYPAFRAPMALPAPTPGVCSLTEINRASGCLAAKPTGVRDEEVTFSSDLDRSIKTLKGVLHVPQGLSGRRPAAVLIHGSGSSDRNAYSPGGLLVQHDGFPLFRELARVLTSLGIIVLRYDKRSCLKCYDGANFEPGRDTFLDYLDDAKSALRFLKTRQEVDSDRLIVIGHSQGGQFAPFAAKDDKSVAAVVMMAGPLTPFLRNGAAQIERYSAVRQDQFDYLTPLLVAGQAEAPRACAEALDKDFDRESTCSSMGPNPQWVWKEYEDLGAKTVEQILSLDCPVLSVRGNLDLNVDPNGSRALAKAAKGRSVEVHLLEGVGHSFVNGQDTPDPLAIDEGFVKVLESFLASVRPGAPAARDPGEATTP